MNNEQTRSKIVEILGLEFDNRHLDRNLQALRKKGTIGFDSKSGWGLR